MKIAVASCAKLQQIQPQTVWNEIQAERPDALLLLGDNVYLEHDHHQDPDDLARELQQRYALQLAEPNFRALLADLKARGKPLLAIYDDHDFLGNNRYGGDHDPRLRLAARKALIEAFDPPRTGDEVYSAHRLGPVQLFVLDARFHRNAPGVSKNDRDAVLGPTQWRWLEDLARRDDAPPYLLIASSTTFHTFADESWEQYPAAFERLRALLLRKPGGLVVSGDVHRNALYDDSGVIEVVTSAVARRGIVFGAERRNYALLEFDAMSLRVTTRSIKSHWRFDVRVPLEHWTLP